jgi:hypothetical protein
MRAFLATAALFTVHAAFAPEQLHVTVHPDPDTLTVSWVSFEPAPKASVVQYGALPSKLTLTANGTFFSYENDLCPGNSSRSVHTVSFGAPQGSQTFYRVSSDGLLWSAVFNVTGILQNKTSQTFSIFGDLAVYNTNNAAEVCWLIGGLEVSVLNWYSSRTPTPVSFVLRRP